jgi:hypothetical protein
MGSMSDEASQLAFLPEASCQPCRLPSACGEAGTARGCGPRTVSDLLHPDAPDFLARLHEVNGLELGITVARDQDLPPIPDYLPQVDPWTAPVANRSRTVATTWGRFARRGGARLRSRQRLAERLALGPDAIVFLLMIAPDHTLEKLWRDRARLLDALDVLRPNAVVGPAFSVWGARAAIEQRYAMARGLRMYSAIQDRGIPAIPMIDWDRPRDREDWARWLNDNSIPAIGYDLQCAGPDIRRAAVQLGRLREALDRPVQLLVNGRTLPEDIASVFDVWPEASFTSDPVPLAATGNILSIDADGATRRVRFARPNGQSTMWPSTIEPTRFERFALTVETMERSVVEGRQRADRRRSAA